MKKAAIILTILNLLSCTDRMHYSYELQEKLDQLDRVLERKDEIEANKKAQLAELHSKFDPGMSLEERYLHYEDLFGAYYKYNTDSTMKYARLINKTAAELKSEDRMIRSSMQIAEIYTLSGKYSDAEEILQKIDTSALDNELLTEYYQRQRVLYDSMAEDTEDERKKEEYKKKKDRYIDAVLSVIDPSSQTYSYLYAEMLIAEGRLQEAIDRLKVNISKPDIGKNTYAINCYILARCYYNIGETEKALTYYTISAINDLEIPIYGYKSLCELSMMLYELEDIERAYSYMLRSQRDIAESNHMGSIQALFKMVPLISSSYETEMNKKNTQLTYILMTLVTVLIGLITLLFILNRQRKRRLSVERQILDNNEELKKLNERLSRYIRNLKEANNMKDLYLGHYLDMCSNYIEGLSRYRSELRQVAKTGGANLLTEKLKSNDFIDEELKKFYSEFDATFIEMFPLFVEQLNELLLPEKRIDIDSKNGLTTELRVMALIRLGINDSVQIARFLRRSTSTIYNYRVKMRNSALGDRDNFEENLVKIGKSL